MENENATKDLEVMEIKNPSEENIASFDTDRIRRVEERLELMEKMM